MNSKISLIVPVYNIEKYIIASVNSILSQTYDNLEIILVNDGSTDDSSQLIDDLARQDSRIKVIHKPNGGVTSARLCGVTAAIGEWIGFVDGDDIVEPQMFERLLNNAIQHKADISHCGYQMVFPNGRVDYYYNSGRIVQQDQVQGLCELISGVFVEPGLWNKLFKRELFDGIENWMDRSVRINEDLLMNYYLFDKADSSIYEDVCPYHYILRKNSATTGKLNINKLTDPLRVIKTILNNAHGKVYEIAYARYIRQLIGLSTMSCKADKDLIVPWRKIARKELRGCLKELLNRDIGIRLKVSALITVIAPIMYSVVHSTYSKLKGHDKKYKID